MEKNKIKTRLIHFIRAYGFNAIVGFGLGIAIVFVVFAISGKHNIFGQEAPGKNPQITSAQDRAREFQEQMKLGEEAEPQKIDSLFSLDNKETDNLTDLQLKDRVTVLLIGMDNRPGEIISNTDTLIVASLDPKNKKMVLLSIPRDTQVILDNKKEKINAIARLRKGPISTQEYIQELIGTPINGYVLTNFQGFKNIVDSLGGITINVEKDMYYDTGDSQDRYINLKKGSQRLNGTQALQYARFRNDELADISRASRQQEVIKAIVAEATTPRNLPKLPIIIPKIYQAIETNLNLGQVWSLAMAFKNKDTYEVINQTLPGQFSDEEGISYWKVNTKESKAILKRLFEGHTAPIFDKNIRRVEAPVKAPSVQETKETPEQVPEAEGQPQERDDGSTITIEVLTTDYNPEESTVEDGLGWEKPGKPNESSKATEPSGTSKPLTSEKGSPKDKEVNKPEGSAAIIFEVLE